MWRMRSGHQPFSRAWRGVAVLDTRSDPGFYCSYLKFVKTSLRQNNLPQRLYMAVSSKKTLEQMKVIWKKGSDPFACKRKRELYYQ